MAERHYEEGVEVLRGMWQFGALMDFVRRFETVLALPAVDDSLLERGLVHPFNSEALETTHVRLLQELLGDDGTQVNLFSWPRVLLDTLAQHVAYLRWLEGEAPEQPQAPTGAVEAALAARARYEGLGVRVRVGAAYELCMRLLEHHAHRLRALAADGTPRTAPVGRDSQGRLYYVPSGVGRLLRLTPPSGERQEAWETVARTPEQWGEAAEGLERAGGVEELRLARRLREELLPQVLVLAAEGRAAMRRELQQMPRKRSTRLQERTAAADGLPALDVDEDSTVEQVKLYHEQRLKETLLQEEQKARAREQRALEQQRLEEEAEAKRAEERERREQARVQRRQRRASSIGEEYLEAALESMGALVRKAPPEPVEDPVLDRPCVPCRKGHVRCDRQFPCGRCAKKGIQDQCEESVTGRRPYEEAEKKKAEKAKREEELRLALEAGADQQPGGDQAAGQQGDAGATQATPAATAPASTPAIAPASTPAPAPASTPAPAPTTTPAPAIAAPVVAVAPADVAQPAVAVPAPKVVTSAVAPVVSTPAVSAPVAPVAVAPVVTTPAVSAPVAVAPVTTPAVVAPAVVAPVAVAPVAAVATPPEAASVASTPAVATAAVVAQVAPPAAAAPAPVAVPAVAAAPAAPAPAAGAAPGLGKRLLPADVQSPPAKRPKQAEEAQ